MPAMSMLPAALVHWKRHATAAILPIRIVGPLVTVAARDYSSTSCGPRVVTAMGTDGHGAKESAVRTLCARPTPPLQQPTDLQRAFLLHARGQGTWGGKGADPRAGFNTLNVGDDGELAAIGT